MLYTYLFFSEWMNRLRKYFLKIPLQRYLVLCFVYFTLQKAVPFLSNSTLTVRNSIINCLLLFLYSKLKTAIFALFGKLFLSHNAVNSFIWYSNLERYPMLKNLFFIGFIENNFFRIEYFFTFIQISKSASNLFLNLQMYCICLVTIFTNILWTTFFIS